MDKVRNEEVRWRTGIERELGWRADQRVLRWFGNVERMNEHSMAKSMWRAGTGQTEVRLDGWSEGGL